MIKKSIPAFLALAACAGVFLAIQSMLPPPASASGIVPAIVPALVPTANKTSTTSTVFALASSSALTASSAVCTNANGDMTTTACTTNAVTSTTPVTVNTNVTTDQQLMELSLTAGYLNSLGKPFRIASEGVYTTQTGQTPTLTFKAKLCTVSGCGSGTVVTLVSITTTATNSAQTNLNWGLNLNMATAATGATGNLETHGLLNVDLSTSPTAADAVFGDTNTAVSSNIDLTAALFLDWTVAFSTNAAGANTCTQREGVVSPGGSTSGGGSGGGAGPGASAYNSGTQNINNTTAALTFNTNQWDTCSACTIHSTSVNPTRFTAPSAGYYLADCSAVAAATSSAMQLFFDVNGVQSPPTQSTIAPGVGGMGMAASLTSVLKLSANDYVECMMFDVTSITTQANNSSMSLTKLSGTL